MKLAHLTWPEVRDLSRDVVVLVPTGSLEQHGHHLPLFTDSLLATAVAEAAEARTPESVLLTPTLWLGASAHHLAFPGSLSASFDAYIGAVEGVVRPLAAHGFWRFFLLNGHGGNTSPNDVACRRLKADLPRLQIGHAGYFEFIPDDLLASTLTGPVKGVRHACEAETSLMLHLHPDLVRFDAAVDGGLAPEPPIRGGVWTFDELTEHGSWGYPTLATADKGQALFDAAVSHVSAQLQSLAEGVALS